MYKPGRISFISMVIFVIIFSFSIFTSAQTVGPDGSFNYTIPIKLLPGTAGMAPKLALAYNSNSGNGICGMGWKLHGLPYITRDTTHPINYDGNDHYVGGNGRLVDIGDGTYHYEEETFSRFEKIGTQGDGPQYWVETKPDGTKLYYGETEDSRIIAEDHSPNIRLWALCRVQDLHGNYYTVEYNSDSGELYPLKITYTQGNGLSSFRYIEFDYYKTERSDYFASYAFSTSVTTKWLLKSINVTIDGFLLTDDVREYVLTYQYGDGVNPSRLWSVQEFGSDGGALQPITFDWQGLYDGTFAEGVYNRPNEIGFNEGWRLTMSDVNGDGKSDLIALYQREGVSSGIRACVYLSNGDGTFAQGVENAPSTTGFLECWELTMSDVNGDGMADLVALYQNDNVSDGIRAHVFLSNGDGTFGALIYNAPYTQGFLKGWELTMSDVNGDGKSDLIALYRRDDVSDGGEAYVFLSKGDGTLGPGVYNQLGTTGLNVGWKLTMADVNGDCMSDILALYQREGSSSGIRASVYLSKGDGTFVHAAYNSPYTTGFIEGWELTMSDVNGDGKSDLIALYRRDDVSDGGEAYVFLSKGDGTLGPGVYNQLGTTGLNVGWKLTMADVNGDCMSDILALYQREGSSSGIRASVYLSKGDGTFVHAAYNSPYTTGFIEGWELTMSDVNGDGKSDLLALYRRDLASDGIAAYVFLSNCLSYLTTKIYNSIGGEIIIQYKSATQVENAIDPSNKTYPYIANKSPRNLVTKITTHDGRGSEYSTSYAYNNGMRYTGYPYDRKDLLFESVIRTNDQTNEKTVSYYKQNDKDFHGRIEKVEQYAGNDSLMKTVEYTYDTNISTIFSNTKFVRLQNETAKIYELGSLVFTKTRGFAYDDYGNTETVTSNDGSNTILTAMSYAVDTSSWILNRTTEIHTTSGGTTLKWSKFNYTGNFLTSKEEYLDTETRWITTFFGYDSHGNVTSITNALNHTITFGYDSDYHTFVTTITDPKNYVVTREYDARFGVITSVTDPNNNETTYEYDEFGRLTRVIEPGDSWTKEMVYNLTGEANTQYIETRTKDDNEGDRYHYNRVYFDGLNRQYKIVSKAHKTDTQTYEFIVDRIYDGTGKLWKESNPYIQGKEDTYYTVYEYNDPAGRLTKKTDPDTTYDTYAYLNASGRLVIQRTDARNTVYRSEFDAKGRLVRKVDAYGDSKQAEVNYVYDEMGMLLQVTDPGNSITTIDYDSLGRKLSINDPNTGSWTYSYDDLGRLVSQTDAKNQTRTFQYDELSRIVLEDNPEGTPDVTYAYNDSTANSKGRLTGVNDGVSETTFAYDEKGNVSTWTKKIDNIDFAFSSVYDPRNRLTELTYPDGKIIERRYADAGYLQAVLMEEGEDEGALVQYGRVIDGEVFQNTMYRITGNGVKTEIAYLPTNHNPDTVVTKKSDETVIENVAYTFDEVGNITKLQDNLNAAYTQDLEYDKLNRISYAKGIYGTRYYNFNSQGNLVQKGGLTLSYNDQSHPHAVTNDSSGYTYAYDANGNMTTRRGKTLQYNAKNRLVSVLAGETKLEEYFYDYTGFRVKKWKDDGSIVYNIGGLYELYKSTGNPDRHRKFIKGMDGDLVAQMTSIEEGGQSRFFIITRDMYNWRSPRGFALAVYSYLRSFIEDADNYRVLLLGLMSLFIIVLLGAASYFRIFRRERTPMIPVWLPRAACMVLIVFVAAFGFTGCWYSDFDNLNPEGIQYFHPDHIGSVKMITGTDGTVVSELRYTPFGELDVSSTGTDVSKYLYTAQERDTGTDLYYYSSRYYDPYIGRFIKADTVVPDPTNSHAYNRYLYVNGNPQSYSDPTGHFSLKPRKKWSKKFTYGSIFKNMVKNPSGITEGLNNLSKITLPIAKKFNDINNTVIGTVKGAGKGLDYLKDFSEDRYNELKGMTNDFLGEKVEWSSDDWFDQYNHMLLGALVVIAVIVIVGFCPYVAPALATYLTTTIGITVTPFGATILLAALSPLAVGICVEAIQIPIDVYRGDGFKFKDRLRDLAFWSAGSLILCPPLYVYALDKVRDRAKKDEDFEEPWEWRPDY